MDRDAVARAGRRSQAEEALAFEREREAALHEQLVSIVLEDERPRIDAEAFATLDPDDARRVRDALGELPDEDDPEAEDDPFSAELYVSFEDDDVEDEEDEEDEVARLEREIEESRRTQAALERFAAALDRPAVPEAG